MSEVAWCQPDYEGKIHSRKFMVVYEDSEMGSAIFDDEAEAREHFEKASIAWNCYLFGLLPSVPSQFLPDVQGNGWMPIETAPKGEDVLLGVVHPEGWSHVAQGRWVAAEEDQIDQPGHDAGFVDCEYQAFFPGRSFGPEKHQYKGTQPTHWQHLPAAPASPPTQVKAFQDRVADAHHALFHDDPTDVEERRARFYEEATETAQAFGMTIEDMHRIVDYSGNRPVGEPAKEIGGTLVTLASLCVVAGFDMAACGEADLAALQTPEKIAKVRAKRATRHGRGPLPGFDASLPTDDRKEKGE